MERLDVQPEFAQWLPFARSRIRAIRTLNLMYVSQHFAVDGVDIWVRIAGKESYITISGETGGYQFCASTLNVSEVPIVGGPAEEAGVKIICSSAVYARLNRKGDDWVATPTGSTAEVSENDPPKWIVADADKMTGLFKIKNIWMVNSFPEYAFFPSSEGTLQSRPLVTVWAPTDPLYSSEDRIYTFRRQRATDVFYDIGATFAGARRQVPDADWYRQAGVGTFVNPNEDLLPAKSPLKFGPRRFIGQMDISGVLHIYPSGVSDIAAYYPESEPYLEQNIKTSVAQKFVRSLLVPIPAWARQITPDRRDLINLPDDTPQNPDNLFPDYKWVFSSDMTKLSVVLLEDFVGFPAEDPDETVMGLLVDGYYPILENLSGLLEVEIKITITGKNPEDFEAELVVKRDMRPSVTQRCILAAEYAWAIPGATDIDEPVTALDDLVTLEGSIYHSSSERLSTTNHLNLFANKRIVEVKNVTADTVIRTFLAYSSNRLYSTPTLGSTQTRFSLPVGEDFKEAGMTIIAMDLRTLSFVLQQKYKVEQADWSYTIKPQLMSAEIVQRLVVYTRNEIVETVDLDAASPLLPGMIAHHADTSVSGMFKYPLDDVGFVAGFAPYNPGETPGPDVGVNDPRRSTCYTDDTYRGWSDELPRAGISGTGEIYPFPASDYEGHVNAGVLSKWGGYFHFGPFMYRTYMMNVLQLHPRDKFCVHPNGSYSITTGPVFYYAGPLPRALADADVDVTKIKQERIDIVSFRKKDKSEIKTTHLALYNKAYGRNIAPQDLRCQFTANIAGASIGFNPGIPAPVKAVRFLGVLYPGNYQTYRTSSPGNVRNLDARYVPRNSQFERVGGQIGATTTSIPFQAAFFSGSALFF